MKTAFHNEDTTMLGSIPQTRRLSTMLAASVLALACLAGAQPAQAALDATASTNDHNTNVPTGWWMYHGLTAAQVGSYASTNGARLTQVNVDSVVSGSPRFSVRMVRNAGSYSVPGWWWYYGLTFAQVGSYLSTNNARLIDMEPYDAGGGAIRYAVVMVSNTGTAARAWSYLSGVTQPQISTHLANSGHRMIDVDTYYVGATKYYSMVAVANTGADAKAWQWWINQSTAGVAAKVSAFNGRVVKMDRQKDGTYNVILTRNTGSDATAWWYRYGFTSGTDLINYANQVASRPVDINSYVDGLGIRRYDAAFIDTANASTRRMRSLHSSFLDSNGNPTIGIFESYLKQVGGTTKVDLNSRRRAETASALKSLHLLHSMRRVAAGTDTLPSSFVYYDYRSGTLTERKNACPDPSLETPANSRMDYNFETGLDQMMSISDNRTTRGSVIRYGGFAPFNATASLAGMTGTTLRHNIGCAYKNFSTGKIDPANRRNDTTAADLARIYEGVWDSSLLSNTNNARTEFLESANPAGSVAGTALQTIINEEATKLGKSATVASQFGQLIQRWGKGGSYNTCLPDSNGGCGQKVIVRSGTGIIRLPIKVSGVTSYRTYVFGRFISDVKTGCWEDTNTATIECPADTNYTAAYSKAANELYRDEIRLALMTW
ncbi:serine hydrolase [Agrilutibacter solisilvae]|uniref:Serine hydrolase n=1 Tax=Agrilutibacter solisilvae TaxID=2763317 RepID=A0A975AR79_9GAMM|nr:serine hydrolase [Lysobacter solisilvae]QSX77018.1 serine hydrolase [Lysobacter solisilvae]